MPGSFYALFVSGMLRRMEKLRYTSTRSADIDVSVERAIVDGLAPDGGLYVPRVFPGLPERVFDPAPLEYSQLAALVLEGYFPDWDRECLEAEVKRACASFDAVESFSGAIGAQDSPGAPSAALDPAPLVEACGMQYLELFRGPTCAFKDFALSLMGSLLRKAMDRLGMKERVAILVATSGDTGSAALAGFRYKPGVSTIVYYPATGTSTIQRLQMTTTPDPAQAVFGIRGSFDDAQRGVKRIFADSERIFRDTGIRLSSANSINVARLLPQIVYYVKAWRDLAARGRLGPGGRMDVAVPTGNFGDILAAHYARQMGLPVGRFICASNRNNVLADFFRTGVYDRRREFVVTSSPSMDILVSSNLERAVFEATGRDPERTSSLMRSLSETGVYALSEGERAWFADFEGGWTDEAGTEAEIGRVFRESGYLVDPHTAVASAVVSPRVVVAPAVEVPPMVEAPPIVVAQPIVVCATASPFKFPAVCLKALRASGSGAAGLKGEGRPESAPEVNGAPVAGAGESAGDGDLKLVMELSRVAGCPMPAPIASLVEARLGEGLREVHGGAIACEDMEAALLAFLGGLR